MKFLVQATARAGISPSVSVVVVGLMKLNWKQILKELLCHMGRISALYCGQRSDELEIVWRVL